MEETENPTEAIQDHLKEHAAQHPDPLIGRVALTAAVFAVLAAVVGLVSSHHANEAMVEQIQAADSWAYYQAKGVKSSVLESKTELLAALGKEVGDADRAKLKKYAEEQNEISAQAKERETSSQHHLAAHLVYARAVTMFQVAIAVAAIAALSRKRLFWFVGLAFGAVGLVFVASGLVLGV